jgi:hypothetical protein
VGDRFAPAWASVHLGTIATLEGKDDEARQLLDQCREDLRTLDMKVLDAAVQRFLSVLALRAGEAEQAERCCAESVRLAKEVDDTQAIAWALIYAARIKMVHHDLAGARASLEEGLTLALSRSERLPLPAGLEGLAFVQMVGAAQDLREVMGAPIPPIERAEYEERVAEIASALGEAHFGMACRQGRGMTPEQVLLEPVQTTRDASALTLSASVGSHSLEKNRPTRRRKKKG